MKKKSALWFWLFWALIVILIGGVTYTAVLVMQPTHVKRAASSSSDATFAVNLNREQLNALATSYLKDAGDNFIFSVNQNDVTLAGKVKILGQSVDADMKMVPEATSDGNVVLKTQSISLGHISLPVNVAMGYIKQLYDGPSYVHIQPDQEQITIDLADVSKNKSLRFKATKLDMTQGQFQFLGEIKDAEK